MSVIDGLNLDTDDYADEELFDIGLDVIAGRFPEMAVEIGEELLARQYTGGFEVKARALGALYDYEQAVDVLREGIENAPEVWPLWSFLGCYLGELEEWDESRDSFRKAISLPHADVSRIHREWATVELNGGNFSEARALAEHVKGEDEQAQRDMLFFRIHWSEGKLEEAYRLGKEMLARDDGEDESWRALAAASLGQVCLRLEKRDEAMALLHEACQLDDAEHAVLWLARELGGHMAEGTPTMYELMYEGTEEVDGELLGFMQRYDVTASSEEEALSYAAAYQELTGNTGLKLDSASAAYQRGPTMAGVYSVMARYYFSEDEE